MSKENPDSDFVSNLIDGHEKNAEAKEAQAQGSTVEELINSVAADAKTQSGDNNTKKKQEKDKSKPDSDSKGSDKSDDSGSKDDSGSNSDSDSSDSDNSDNEDNSKDEDNSKESEVNLFDIIYKDAAEKNVDNGEATKQKDNTSPETNEGESYEDESGYEDVEEDYKEDTKEKEKKDKDKDKEAGYTEEDAVKEALAIVAGGSGVSDGPISKEANRMSQIREMVGKLPGKAKQYAGQAADMAGAGAQKADEAVQGLGRKMTGHGDMQAIRERNALMDRLGVKDPRNLDRLIGGGAIGTGAAGTGGAAYGLS